MKLKVIINNVDYSKYATLPNQTQITQDESLDVAYIELVGLNKELPFKPFSDLYIKMTDKANNIKEYNMYVQNDNVEEIISKKKFNHKLLIIEKTKITERFFVEKTITNPLYHDYTTSPASSWADLYEEQSNSSTTVEISEIPNLYVLSKPISFESADDFIEKRNVSYNIGSQRFLGMFDADNNQINGTGGQSTPFIPTDVLTSGIYTIKYYYTRTVSLPTSPPTYITYRYTYTINISIVSQPVQKDDYLIVDTINKLLINCETLRRSETPRFELANIEDYVGKSQNYKDQVEKILAMKSPEFAFGKQSLYEALKQVGDYAHFLPRLEGNKIYLDLLGRREKSNISKQKECSNMSTQTIEQFCSKIDSQVSNFINLDDIDQGSIITPFNDGYRTLRTVTGVVQITDTNMIIPTEDPIEKVVKLEIGYLSDGTFVGDITPYVYEEAEYNALDAYASNYPYARMYALKFKQGTPNITELSFTRETVTGVESSAIKNIIYRKVGKGVSWWQNLFDTENPLKLQYRLTYIPDTDTKITQSKAYIEDVEKTISIAYNQTASKISSNAYGENLKGAIAKFGNVEKTKMYILPTLDLIPEVGTLFDEDYYISIVKCEYYPNFIKCEVGLSKNYNNKSAYVETNSQLRYYEISEKYAQDRYVIYEDYCEVGDVSQTDNKCLITNDGLNQFASAFNRLSANKSVGLVTTTGNYKTFNLPAISLGVGNSLLFSYHYVDNYSAGDTVSTTSAGTRIQNMQRYTDEYGELYYLDLKLGTNNQTYNSYNEAIEVGDEVPVHDLENATYYFDTTNDPIILDKDNRERIIFTYQIHFVSNRPNLIIGSGLARKSAFTTDEVKDYKLYLLDDKINKFESKIDLTKAKICDTTITTNVDSTNQRVSLNSFVANDNGVAWAICQGEDLIVGENMDITNGQEILLPTFTFKRKIGD